MANTRRARPWSVSKERLERMAEQTGRSRQELLDEALRRYEKELYLDMVNEGYAALRANPESWQEELDERAAWDETLRDSTNA